MNSKYGYIITSTPGQIEEGSYPITIAAIKENEALSETVSSDFAVFQTQARATTAMHKLVPAGSTPEAWAGLRVELAYPYIISAVFASRNYVGVDDFIVPTC